MDGRMDGRTELAKGIKSMTVQAHVPQYNELI